MNLQATITSPQPVARGEAKGQIAVFGAYGHTGRFVVAELQRRGWLPILIGRDEGKLQEVAGAYPASSMRVASVDDAASLDRALVGALAVINCAGPFGESARALIEAALRARIHYLDVTGETLVALSTFDAYGADGPRGRAVQDAGIVVAPSVAFYGALGDLLATAAMGDWSSADEVSIAVALDGWKPTRGTRLAGERRAGRRVVFANGQIAVRSADEPVPGGQWLFPEPFGQQDVLGEFSTVDVVTASRHLDTPRINAYINMAPIIELRNPQVQGPEAVDDSGRSAQQFLMEVVVRKGSEQHRAHARGQDIYAITAPIVVEAAERILDGRVKATGVVAPGQAFDARDFLAALSPAHLTAQLG